uniref:60S acidic ribosomal protein P1 n=1 Tax=Chromera velia CCMP2878 TaxID=1169474 RepID=A0A0G4FJM7_9ALVE|eukprot:Cvel_17325.t1-p1 / transcript=Cvel_17325.t1 / gene=Cvel_17325 / organism=Chromera_velia_CCMP2878 / gene_product=60S acidic ribosomal protein P1, putative / transcript_product=60S acidic ribosomal protein P1, putative / location=Cvel_scaffold1376:13423-15025(-) / protein_length=120 / sequence_SO=supercontig / SO=protein_coding / is_pseudo=false
MAAVPVSQLSDAEKGELLCTYAALILHDDEIEISADNMNKLISATGAKVEAYLPGLFAKLFKDVKVGDLISNVGSGGGGGGAPAAAGGDGGAAGGAAEEKKEAAPVEEEEEEAMDFDLFD